MINETKIPQFIQVFASMMGVKFSARQIEAITLLLKECISEQITDPRKIAYVLATCWHECRFKSIPEIRAKPGTQVWRWQNVYWPSGYYGRGFSQLTWRRNYKKFSPIVGEDLVKYPDKVLDPAIGAKILVVGMSHGLFSGVGLSKFFPENSSPEWIKARGIVNGTFQAEIVAANAVKIFSIIQTVEGFIL